MLEPGIKPLERAIIIHRLDYENEYDFNKRYAEARQKFSCPAITTMSHEVCIQEYSERVAHLAMPLAHQGFIVDAPIMETSDAVWFLQSRWCFSSPGTYRLTKEQLLDFYAPVPTIKNAATFQFASDAKSVAGNWSRNSSLEWERVGVATVRYSLNSEYDVDGFELMWVNWTHFA